MCSRTALYPILFFKEISDRAIYSRFYDCFRQYVVMRAARSIAATRAYDYPRRSAIAGGASPGR